MRISQRLGKEHLNDNEPIYWLTRRKVTMTVIELVLKFLLCYSVGFVVGATAAILYRWLAG